ncbi:Lrp/AsnC family transcriptional regulator [archaeon]|nr:MAG: Lrp/AsnC family transcriptional regulator [archaeon]RLG63982.1 MAG: Lrp/AsnC family transcriptional regulator [archaeon]RLG66265.1 MAG: Lrp/AsnC family transcriptional regulator [archaeon]HDM23545.1 Lrp/AsnC family transcriptional regulator [Candidatus Bathyarchaeota archaeon]
MSAIAYVLINTEIGAEKEVLEQLKKIPEIEEAYIVYGVYDIIAKINADNIESLKNIIRWKIRTIDKVRSTLTMLTVTS